MFDRRPGRAQIHPRPFRAPSAQAGFDGGEKGGGDGLGRRPGEPG